MANAKTVSVTFMIPVDMLEKVEKVQQQLAAGTYGTTFNRTDALRHIIGAGLVTVLKKKQSAEY